VPKLSISAFTSLSSATTPSVGLFSICSKPAEMVNAKSEEKVCNEFDCFNDSL
jgi:hypothetical protein